MVGQAEHQSRQHRDVQARNTDEVTGAGATEGFPLRGIDGSLVANRQCLQDAAIGLAGQRRRHPDADMLAQSLDGIG